MGDISGKKNVRNFIYMLFFPRSNMGGWTPVSSWKRTLGPWWTPSLLPPFVFSNTFNWFSESCIWLQVCLALLSVTKRMKLIELQSKGKMTSCENQILICLILNLVLVTYCNKVLNYCYFYSDLSHIRYWFLCKVNWWSMK